MKTVFHKSGGRQMHVCRLFLPCCALLLRPMHRKAPISCQGETSMNYYTGSCRGNGCCPSDPYSYVTIQGATAVPSVQRAIPARRNPLVPEASAEKKANRASKARKATPAKRRSSPSHRTPH